MAAAITRSVTFYDVAKLPSLEKGEYSGAVIFQDLEDDMGQRFCSLLDQRIEEDADLVEFLVQQGLKNSTQAIYPVALLASIPPMTLIHQLEKLKGTFTRPLSVDEIIRAADAAMANPTKLNQGTVVINNLKQLDKKDEKVVEVLVKFVQHYAFPEWREGAVVALGQFPSKPSVNEALMKQYKAERVPKVKASILTTLGDLKAVELSSELKKIASGDDNRMAIRAEVALSTMNGESMSEDERRKSALRLCQLVSTAMAEERRLVAIGLSNLKIGDEQEVLETLLKLLQDENASVKLEAGRTLTVIKFN